jgi:hypothetical protein
MFAGVAVRRTVAAERGATRLARSKVDPRGADLHTLVALPAFRLSDSRNRTDVAAALVRHQCPFLMKSVAIRTLEGVRDSIDDREGVVMHPRDGFSLRACVVIVVLMLIVALPAAQTTTVPVRFSAVAVNLDGMTARTGLSILEIAINRWSTAAEREKLLRAVLEKGPETLLDVLRDMRPVGSIRTPDSLAYDLRFAHRMPADEGGERIVLATDRYMSFWEVANRPRSVDYPFMLIELRINRNGEGEGKMSIATKIIADKKNNVIVLENYGSQPVMLNQVERKSTR